jgi:Cys-rich four helix bundle protein (predicted Tat secretion target)
MDRRQAILGVSAASLALLTASAGAEVPHQHTHGATKFKALIDSASDCVKTGNACAAHCVTLFSQGDKEMAVCQSTVMQTVAICAALQQLASLDSPHLLKVAAAARDICLACEAECRKHESKHSVCTDCGDACAACAKHCEALSTAA